MFFIAKDGRNTLPPLFVATSTPVLRNVLLAETAKQKVMKLVAWMDTVVTHLNNIQNI